MIKRAQTYALRSDFLKILFRYQKQRYEICCERHVNNLKHIDISEVTFGNVTLKKNAKNIDYRVSDSNSIV